MSDELQTQDIRMLQALVSIVLWNAQATHSIYWQINDEFYHSV